MSLDLSKLQKLVELADGSQRAQCPACAEAGQDRKGEHLRIYPDGKFGCCVFAGDREHRQRIFALAGERRPRVIKVKVAAVQSSAAIQSGVLGRLGRLFAGPAEAVPDWDAWDGGNAVDLNAVAVGTAGTGGTNSTGNNRNNLGTLGTAFSNPRACAQETAESENTYMKLIEFGPGVPSVPSGERLPYLLNDGTLVIPFSSPARFHWWRGGQSVKTTREEVSRQNTEHRKEEHGADV